MSSVQCAPSQCTLPAFDVHVSPGNCTDKLNWNELCGMGSLLLYLLSPCVYLSLACCMISKYKYSSHRTTGATSVINTQLFLVPMTLFVLAAPVFLHIHVKMVPFKEILLHSAH